MRFRLGETGCGSDSERGVGAPGGYPPPPPPALPPPPLPPPVLHLPPPPRHAEPRPARPGVANDHGPARPAEPVMETKPEPRVHSATARESPRQRPGRVGPRPPPPLRLRLCSPGPPLSAAVRAGESRPAGPGTCESCPDWHGDGRPGFGTARRRAGPCPAGPDPSRDGHLSPGIATESGFQFQPPYRRSLSVRL